MRTEETRTKLIVGVALSLVTGACGGSEAEMPATARATTTAPTTTEPDAEATTTTTPPAPTSTRAGTTTQAGPSPDFAEVNAVSLTYECFGSGSPAVVFEHGWAPPEAESYNPSWGGVRLTLEAISKFTTACVYGRRGVMGSDPVATAARTARDQVADLGGFIDSIGIETPVVLIGYSWGGELVRLFVGENPDEVAGLVLVDSQHPEADAAFGQETPPPLAPEMIDLPTSHDQVGQVDDLGKLPIYLLSSTSTFPDAPPEIQQIWDDLQDDLATLSSDTKLGKVEGYSHFEIPGAADEIAAAMSDVIERAER